MPKKNNDNNKRKMVDLITISANFDTKSSESRLNGEDVPLDIRFNSGLFNEGERKEILSLLDREDFKNAIVSSIYNRMRELIEENNEK